MTRITPRTCLWPLTISLILTFGLSIGLTYRSDHHCYAGTCGENLFPLQARLHVVVWYFWISISVAFLAIRAFSSPLRRHLRQPLIERKLPYIGLHLTVSGVLLAFWITALYGTIVGIWWTRLYGYFGTRGRENGVFSGNHRLAAIALTGHVCDVTMGMVLLPISRHSALASFFKLSVSTTLAFHKLAAYFLFFLVLLHGFLYVSWIPVWHQLSAQLRMVFPVLNPTYLISETWPGDTSSLGFWRASLPFTGLTTTIIMCLIFVTTLPIVRAKHFNTFYFTHLTVIIAIIIICLHASTMFYCLAPGLVMWLLDWWMRLYELRKVLPSTITTYGKGWYCLRVALPRHRLQGCACTSPLAHFYLHHANSSSRELHPFTTITHLASENRITPDTQDDLMIEFLFRKRGRVDKDRSTSLPKKDGFAATALRLFTLNTRQKSQWTDQLAALAHTRDTIFLETQANHLQIERTTSCEAPSRLNSLILSTMPGTTYHNQTTVPVRQQLGEISPSSEVQSQRTPSLPLSSFDPETHTNPIIDIQIRLEGPYFTPSDPTRFSTVVCFVAGTGISGAIAIVNAFKEHSRSGASSPPDNIDACAFRVGAELEPKGLPQTWQKCIVVWSVREDDYAELPFLRPWPGLEVREHLTGKGRQRLDLSETLQEIVKENPGRTWVYLSGSTDFVVTGEKVCKTMEGRGVEYYGARW